MFPEEKLAFIQQLLDDTAIALFDSCNDPDNYRDFYEAVRILVNSDHKQTQSIKELESFRIKAVIARGKLVVQDQYSRYLRRKY
jgi:hypothetical protein